MGHRFIQVNVFSRGCAVAAGLSVVLASGCTPAAPHHASAGLSAGCSLQVTAGRVLAGVRPVTASVPARPTAMVATPDGQWAFASLTAQDAGEIAVLALGRGKPRLVRTVPLPPELAGGYGMAMTHDGRLLVVTGNTATAVLSAGALADGRGNPVVGVLADAGSGAYEVTVSADDRYVFVADETTGGLSVFDLALALRRGFGARGVAVGIVPLVPSPANGESVGAVDVALSPDGTLAYLTTLGGIGPRGQLWVVDVARAESGAGRAAVLAHAAAGCQPVRVAVSPDGATVWVTAQESDALLGFSAAALRRDPSRALTAVVRVGSEPTGLLLADGGQIALVTNSNRFLIGPNVNQTVSVVGTAAALAHRPALIGAVPAGRFPRDLSLVPATGQVLLANFTSGTVEEFPVPKPG